MDVVIRTPHGEAEITIARADKATVIADIVESVTGSASPPIADVDGRAILTTATIGGSGVVTGSVIDLGPPTRNAPNDAVVALVQIAGWGAGTRQALGPGTYRIGPGRRLHAADLDLAHVDKTAFELSIDGDGSATVTIGELGVRIDGIGVEGSAAWAAGILDVAGRAFELDRDVGQIAHPAPRADGVPSGMVVFNRPPRPARAKDPPPLTIPEVVDATRNASRATRRARRQGDGSLSAGQHAQVAFRGEVVARRSAERQRLHDLFPHVANAAELAGTGSPRLWSTRPDDDEAFRFAIGLGDIEWRPALTSAAGSSAVPESVVAEFGRLPMVPVTVDLRDERGVAFVGSGEFTRAAVRGLLVEACVQHGPADLDVVVLTDPDRAEVWEWVKWLPHNRTSGVAQVLVALDQIDGWVASVARSIDDAALRARPNHLTLAIVDEADWWRDRAAPLRRLMHDASQPVRFVALVDGPNDAPTLCRTLVTEQSGDLARVERIGERIVDDDVQLFLLSTAVAAATARRLAPYDDPDLDVPVAGTLPLSVPVRQLLGHANLAASTLAARWRTTSPRSFVRVPIGVTERGMLEIDLDRDGPHVLIGGAPSTGKSELLRSLVIGLAVGLPPDAITFALLDLAGGTFGPCASLPHVVMHHDVSDAHLAERAVRCLRAELLGRDEAARSGVALPRLVIVVDEPAAVAASHPDLVSSLLEIAVRGERLGVHLILATGLPSMVIDDATAPAIGVRIALRVSDERESWALIGTRDATGIPRRIPGRGLVLVGVAAPVEFQAAVASASSSPGGGHDLELRPYVVGRELTPMELRVVRESNGNPRGTGSRERVQNDLALLVSEITAAAVAVDQARPRQLCADPLPDVVTPRRLATDHPGIGDGVPFALVDLPDQQRQEIRTWQPGAGGSLLIYGAETSGTSSVLASLALGAAERYPADDVHLYVIDAGALSALSELPHTGAVVRPDEVERIARLVQIVGGMIDDRGALSDGELRGAASSKHRSPLPHVVVMIDDVGALRQQLGDRSELDSELDAEVDRELGNVWAGIARIVRDGPAVGVCTVATARGERDVPAGFAAHFPSRLVMRLADTSGYASFGFRSIDVPRFVPGRGLDPADRTELQIVQPPVSLAGAVAALASEPARFHPPVPVEVPTS